MFPKKLCALGILDININLVLRKTLAERIEFDISRYNTVEDLESSNAYKLLHEFNDYVKEDCKRCRFIKHCNGGCPYNGIVAAQSPKAVDPQCEAYKLIFQNMKDRQKQDLIKNGIPGMPGAKTSQEKEEGEPFTIMDLMTK